MFAVCCLSWFSQIVPLFCILVFCMVCYSLPLASYLAVFVCLFVFFNLCLPPELDHCKPNLQLLMCLSVHVNIAHKFITKPFCVYEFQGRTQSALVCSRKRKSLLKFLRWGGHPEGMALFLSAIWQEASYDEPQFKKAWKVEGLHWPMRL